MVDVLAVGRLNLGALRKTFSPVPTVICYFYHSLGPIFSVDLKQGLKQLILRLSVALSQHCLGRIFNHFIGHHL